MSATLRKEMLHLTLNDWATKFKDNPIQRNTEQHAAFALKHHLKSASATHANVNCAVLDGELYKLDGHTRGYLWQNSLLECPQAIYANVYDCTEKQDLIDLYYQFDNTLATEKASDKFYGACRLFGFTPKSTLIKDGGVSGALQLIQQGVCPKQAKIIQRVFAWVPELQMIDSKMYNGNKFRVGTLTALLLTVKAYGNDAFDFWGKFHDRIGTSANGRRDGVQALIEEDLKFTTKNKHSGKHHTNPEIAGKAINTYEGYRVGYQYTGMPKIKPIADYIKEKKLIVV